MKLLGLAKWRTREIFLRGVTRASSQFSRSAEIWHFVKYYSQLVQGRDCLAANFYSGAPGLSPILLNLEVKYILLSHNTVMSSIIIYLFFAFSRSSGVSVFFVFFFFLSLFFSLSPSQSTSDILRSGFSGSPLPLKQSNTTCVNPRG